MLRHAMHLRVHVYMCVLQAVPGKGPSSPSVDRGLALHKMVRTGTRTRTKPNQTKPKHACVWQRTTPARHSSTFEGRWFTVWLS